MPDLTTESLTELDGDVRAAAKEIHTALEANRPLDGTKLAIEWSEVAARHGLTVAGFRLRVALHLGATMTEAEVMRHSRGRLSFLFTD
jgi:hypothetical protein